MSTDTLMDIQLAIPEDAWKPCGGDGNSTNDHKLMASVTLNGQATLYLEAFEVEYNAEDTIANEMNGVQEPVAAMGKVFTEQFIEADQAFYADGPMQVITIKGRPYAVFGCPGRE